MRSNPEPGNDGSTSSQLLAAAQRGEADAWRGIVQLYRPLLYHWCRRSGLPAKDAADVVQEIFRTVAIGLRKFNPQAAGSSFRGWLRTITNCRLIDRARQRTREIAAVGGSSARARLEQVPHPESPSATDIPPTSPPQERLHAALETLRGSIEERTWQAFWRTTVLEESAEDVARDLGMKRHAVFQAKSRVLFRLRKLLADPPAENLPPE